jgi:phosphoribosylformimino-5-aminoimidazole carboxamide ribotide isomerase
MTMIAIPAVDIRDGACVQPSANAAETAGLPLGEPIGIARAWANAGFRRLHVIDVDAANGTGSNEARVDDIIRDHALEIQAGGGIQTDERIERLVDAGASLVVLGPRAIEEPEWLAAVAEDFPGLLVVATDVRERRVVTRGWVRSLPLDIFDVIEELDGLPLGGLLISAVHGSARDGADLALLEDIAEACDFPVIAAGAAATMHDLRALEHRGISGVVIGSALYSGALDARAVASEFGG